MARNDTPFDDLEIFGLEGFELLLKRSIATVSSAGQREVEALNRMESGDIISSKQ